MDFALFYLMMNKPYKMAGFTLIELLIVVAIIGILAAIAIPQYKNFFIKSRRTEGFLIAKGIFAAELGYFAVYNSWGGSMGSYAAINSKIGFSTANPPLYYVFASINRDTPNDFLAMLVTASPGFDSDATTDIVSIRATPDGALGNALCVAFHSASCPAGIPFVLRDDLIY